MSLTGHDENTQETTPVTLSTSRCTNGIIFFNRANIRLFCGQSLNVNVADREFKGRRIAYRQKLRKMLQSSGLSITTLSDDNWIERRSPIGDRPRFSRLPAEDSNSDGPKATLMSEAHSVVPKLPESLHKRITKTKLCVHHAKGKCIRGERCSFAHSPFELREPPDLVKTRLCLGWMTSRSCFKGDECKYAHGEEELRSTPEFYKTSLCPTLYSSTGCTSGDHCRYAHSIKELRKQSSDLSTLSSLTSSGDKTKKRHSLRQKLNKSLSDGLEGLRIDEIINWRTGTTSTNLDGELSNGSIFSSAPAQAGMVLPEFNHLFNHENEYENHQQRSVFEEPIYRQGYRFNSLSNPNFGLHGLPANILETPLQHSRPSKATQESCVPRYPRRQCTSHTQCGSIPPPPPPLPQPQVDTMDQYSLGDLSIKIPPPPPSENQLSDGVLSENIGPLLIEVLRKEKEREMQNQNIAENYRQQQRCSYYTGSGQNTYSPSMESSNKLTAGLNLSQLTFSTLSSLQKEYEEMVSENRQQQQQLQLQSVGSSYPPGLTSPMYPPPEMGLSHLGPQSLYQKTFSSLSTGAPCSLNSGGSLNETLSENEASLIQEPDESRFLLERWSGMTMPSPHSNLSRSMSEEQPHHVNSDLLPEYKSQFSDIVEHLLNNESYQRWVLEEEAKEVDHIFSQGNLFG